MSGRTQEFLFTPGDTVSVVTQHIFDNWPDGKHLQCAVTKIAVTEIAVTKLAHRRLCLIDCH